MEKPDGIKFNVLGSFLISQKTFLHSKEEAKLLIVQKKMCSCICMMDCGLTAVGEKTKRGAGRRVFNSHVTSSESFNHSRSFFSL